MISLVRIARIFSPCPSQTTNKTKQAVKKSTVVFSCESKITTKFHLTRKRHLLCTVVIFYLSTRQYNRDVSSHDTMAKKLSQQLEIKTEQRKIHYFMPIIKTKTFS